MTIEVTQVSIGRRIEVRRDMSYLMTTETTAWLLEKNGDDFDDSDYWKEMEEC